jgi:glutathionyl-hydroquinone reductase
MLWWDKVTDIKRHYSITHDDINPISILRLRPVQDLSAPGPERKVL